MKKSPTPEMLTFHPSMGCWSVVVDPVRVGVVELDDVECLGGGVPHPPVMDALSIGKPKISWFENQPYRLQPTVAIRSIPVMVQSSQDHGRAIDRDDLHDHLEEAVLLGEGVLERVPAGIGECTPDP